MIPRKILLSYGGGRRCHALLGEEGKHSFGTAVAPSTTVLFLSSIYPEPNASAAGVRTTFFLQQLAQTQGLHSIHFGSGAKPPAHQERSSVTQGELERLGVKFHHVPPNKSEVFKELLSGLDNQNGHLLVIFDRFYAEEAYSFHIHQHCPNAAIVLDMQDMHSLRWCRQSAMESKDHEGTATDPLSQLPIHTFPSADDPNLQRELASIHRSDLTLVCSPVEVSLLRDQYLIPAEKLCLAPFFVETTNSNNSQQPTFDQRRDFCFVGGFRHAPNVDAVKQLRRLWPQIRQETLAWTAGDDDDVHLHVYGPFCPRPVRDECHDPANGFFLHGYTPNKSVEELVSKKRLLLAPLRFGAGIKGKTIDSWKFGTPVITTNIGSEGMADVTTNPQQNWGGVVAANSTGFVQGAAELYHDKAKWLDAQRHGTRLLSELYPISRWDSLVAKLYDAIEHLQERRRTDYVRSVLWQQQLRSTEYFSKWLELKEHRQK